MASSVGFLTPAQAAISVCFGSGTCSTQNETQVFLDKATGANSSSGHVGSQNGANTIAFSSTSALDFANGFSTVSIHGNGTFNDFTISAPAGFGFGDLVFRDLPNTTGSGNNKHNDITITAFSGGSNVGTQTFTDFGSGLQTFEVVATGGLLTSVVLSSNAGFRQLKQFEVSDYGTFTGGPPGAVPEASTWAMMLLGFAGLGFAGYRSSRKSRVALT